MIQLFESELVELLCEGYTPKNINYVVHRLRNHHVFYLSGREFVNSILPTLGSNYTSDANIQNARETLLPLITHLRSISHER